MLHASIRILFLIFSICFFVTAQSAPAKATHPLAESTKAFQEIQRSKTFILSDVLKQKKMGLSLESATRQAELRSQAKQFTTFKSPASFFDSVCASADALDKNALCLLEGDRKLVREVGEVLPVPGALDDSHLETGAIREADIDKLSKYSYGTLNRALSGIEASADMAKLVERLQSNKTCYSSALYVSVANKTEEYFPDPDQVKKAKALYEKAADCTTDELGMRARYRFSLLQIWQNSCDKVDQFLSAIEADKNSVSYQSRARYWRHQCAVKSGTQEVRVATEQSLLKNNLLSFHSVVLNGNTEQFSEIVGHQEQTRVMFRSVIRPDLNLRIAGIEALLVNGSQTWAGEYLDKLANEIAGSEPEFRLYAATLAERADNMIAKFKILSALFDDSPRMVQDTTLKMYFPLSYFQQVQLRSKDVDPYLILSLIRQESAFNHRARSAVGARGLMQVMPATARSIAAVSSRRLFDPKTNIQVGTKYFIRSLNQFNGDVSLTLAAYNAGATRVDRWVKRYAGADKILFMDLIPYRETRDYVASILRNHYWYTRLYEKKTSTKDFSARRSS